MRNFYIEIKVPGRKRPVIVSGSEMEIEIRQKAGSGGLASSVLAGQFSGSIENTMTIETRNNPARPMTRLQLRGVVYGIGGSRQFHKITEV
jgi:hypothetical protein